jgi:hypothetical protein
MMNIRTCFRIRIGVSGTAMETVRRLENKSGLLNLMVKTILSQMPCIKGIRL